MTPREVIEEIDHLEDLLTIPEDDGPLACIAVSEALARLQGWREELEAAELAECFRPAPERGQVAA